MKKLSFSILLVVASLMASGTVALESLDRVSGGDRHPRAEFDTTHFLVQLERPLVNSGADGAFGLHTGLPKLDAAILGSGVHRIELALRVSARNPGNPEAFRRYGFDRTYVFHVPEGSDILGVVNRFSKLPEVVYAEPDFMLEAEMVIPNDPRFDEQWSLHQSSDHDVDAPEACEITTGAEVIIAFIDSGADSDHEDLQDKIIAGWNFQLDNDNTEDNTSGHGTGTSSVALASTDNAVGMAGACWGCELMPLVAPVGNYLVADAMVWGTDHGARVINISQSVTTDNETLLNGLSYAADGGVVVVGSAGNTAPIEQINFPAAYLETIAVGGTDELDHWSSPMCGVPNSGSHFGPELDVVAPAEYILRATVDGGYDANFCGTSYSAPLVAGLVGLMHSVNLSVGREEVRHLVRCGADDQVGDPVEDKPGFDEFHGWGRVNFDRTLQGTQAATTLRVDGKSATRVYLETVNPLADSWDFIRGDLSALSEDYLGVYLGSLTCLENDSPDPDTAMNEDTETPAPGEGFFYLSRFNGAPGAGSYGGSSWNRDRMVFPQRIQPDWFVEGDQIYEYMASAATAGDVNGDGYDDLVVGAHRYDDTFNNEGAAFLYLGSADGLEPSWQWTATGGQEEAQFGWVVMPAGDVNDDDYDDVVVTARRYDNGEYNEGAAYLYLGGSTGLSPTHSWSAEGDQNAANFGEWAGTVGDVNNDGYDDVMVVADTYANPEYNEGAAFLYYGSASGLSPTHDWSVESNQSGAYINWFGRAGDVNGDGYDDIVIGAPLYDNGETNEGVVFVYYGSPSGPAPDPDLVLEIDSHGAGFGMVAAGAGDVNGDGYDDVIIGAPWYTEGEVGEGAVFFYPGSPSGLSPTFTWSFQTDQAYAELGWTAFTAGDVNDDDFDDFLVGAPHYDEFRTNSGKVWVFLGSPTGPLLGWSVTGRQSDVELGWRGFTAGDVNGDLLDDVVVGSMRYDNDNLRAGRVDVYHGPLGDAASTECPR